MWMVRTVMVLIGLGLLGYGFNAIRTGKFYDVDEGEVDEVDRETQTLLFWSFVGAVVVTGLGLIGAGFVPEIANSVAGWIGRTFG